MTEIILLFLIQIGFASEDICSDLYTATCSQTNTKLKSISAKNPGLPKDQIQGLWVKILESAEQVITAKVSSKDQQKIILKNIKQVKLVTEDCLNDPTLANANFNGNKVTYCNGNFLVKPSLFEQIAVLAHELGHSLEPCKFDQTTYYFSKIETCLRDEKSAGAVSWGFSDIEQFHKKCTYLESACEKGLSLACQDFTRHGCLEESPRCLKDQINESFADWFSAEVFSVMLKNNHFIKSNMPENQFIDGLKSIVSSTCRSSYSIESIYPQPATRYNKILLAHPDIRHKMGCNKVNTDILYCD